MKFSGYSSGYVYGASPTAGVAGVARGERARLFKVRQLAAPLSARYRLRQG